MEESDSHSHQDGLTQTRKQMKGTKMGEGKTKYKVNDPMVDTLPCYKAELKL